MDWINSKLRKSVLFRHFRYSHTATLSVTSIEREVKLAEKMFPEQQQRRGRHRDRMDQRRPTFQILNAVNSKAHSQARKREFYHFVADPSISENESPHLQTKVTSVHAIPDRSRESVFSGVRGPACNFPGGFSPTNNNAERKASRLHSAATSNDDNRGRPRSQSPDRIVPDEPSDFVVWNASRKTSRSNILCPLTDSEFRNINSTNTCPIPRRNEAAFKSRKGLRKRSNSVPTHYHHNLKSQTIPEVSNHTMEARENMLFQVDSVCKVAAEMLDDISTPPMSPGQISPSISLASTTTTHSMRILLVSQQLKEIQEVQHGIFQTLGEEMSKMTDENEMLKKEVAHIRDQNEDLLKVVHDTTHELERMKQAIRIRGASHHHHQPEIKTEPVHHVPVLQMPIPDDSEDNATPPNNLYPSFHLQQQQQQRTRMRLEQQQQQQERKRESINSTSNSHKVPIMLPVTDNHESGDNAYLTPPPGPDILTRKPLNKGRKKREEHLSDVVGEGEELEPSSPFNGDIEDNNLSYLSTDSNLKVARKRSNHRQPNHRPQTQTPQHHDPRPRNRSRSKERRGSGGRSSKSPRSNNCYEQEEHRRKMKQPADDCNENYETRSGGGCFRFFCCCASTPRTKSVTDCRDDLILRDSIPDD